LCSWLNFFFSSIIFENNKKKWGNRLRQAILFIIAEKQEGASASAVGLFSFSNYFNP